MMCEGKRVRRKCMHAALFRLYSEIITQPACRMARHRGHRRHRGSVPRVGVCESVWV